MQNAINDLNFFDDISSAIDPDTLWLAPEILRTYPPRRSTQPGDVYSFAVILYEMCTRNEPYVTESWYLSLEGMHHGNISVQKFPQICT